MQSQEWEQETLGSVSHEDWAVRKVVQEKRRQDKTELLQGRQCHLVRRTCTHYERRQLKSPECSGKVHS